MSRCPIEASVCVLTSCSPVWLDRVKASYADDPTAQGLILKLQSSANTDPSFSYSDGLIRYKGKVWLGDNAVAQHHVLQAIHQSGVGGHSGVQATYYRIKQLFHWPGLKQAVKKFVAACSVCQQVKVEHIKQPGQLQPQPVSDQAWKTVCMDFIEGLPKSQKFDTTSKHARATRTCY